MATKLETAGQGTVRMFRWLFLVAALYDGILGAVFFLFFRPMFERMGVALPNNTSYIHLTAGFIFVQGVGYWLVYRNMLRNVDLVKVGVVYKAIYALVALYYLAIGQLINAVFAWFAVCDLLFIVGFVWFLVLARPERLEPAPRG
jgi:hypothetical protein